MKRFSKLLMAVVLVMFVSLAPAKAQQKGDLQLRAGVGYFSLPDYVGILLAGFGSIDTTEGITRDDFIPLLNPSVEVEYHFSEHFSLGGFLALGYADARTTLDSTGEINKRATAFYPTLGISFTMRYFRSGNFSMYGSGGVGATLLAFRQTTPEEGRRPLQIQGAPMANVYPLCFKYGNTSGLHVEVGWGSKGLVSVGGFTYF